MNVHPSSPVWTQSHLDGPLQPQPPPSSSLCPTTERRMRNPGFKLAQRAPAHFNLCEPARTRADLWKEMPRLRVSRVSRVQQPAAEQ